MHSTMHVSNILHYLVMYIPFDTTNFDPARPSKRRWKATQTWAFEIQTDDAGNTTTDFANRGPADGEQAPSAWDDRGMEALIKKLKRRASRIRGKQAGENGRFTGFTYDDLKELAVVCRYPKKNARRRAR